MLSFDVCEITKDDGSPRIQYPDVPEKSLNKSIARYGRACKDCIGRVINATDVAHNIRIKGVGLRCRQESLGEPLHVPEMLSIMDLKGRVP